MKYGYARVSTIGQKLDVQLAALKKVGCIKIFQEKISGRSRARPEFKKLMNTLKAGDTLIVTKMDRLARSGLDFHNILQELTQLEVAFECTEQPMLNVNSNVKMGAIEKAVISIIATIAEMEAGIIVERTKEGREYAKKAGVKFGRKPKLNKAQIKLLMTWYQEGKTQKEMSYLLGIHRNTVRNAIKRIENSQI